MPHPRVRGLLLAACIASIALPLRSNAHDYQVGGLKIGHPWSRATPKGAKVGAGYLIITNSGKDPDRLIGGSLENAGRLEVHQMSKEGDVMKMHPVVDGLEIEPGQTIALKPGGYHLMIMDLTKPLKQGQMVHGTLVFEKAGTVPVEFKVEGIGASTPDGDVHDHAH